ncbi:hypothetical protein AAE478_003541 [Parahypoxylon ruwenzoriense]
MVKALILGATGKQGGAAARALLSQGHSVRAFVRSASSPKALALAALGAELFVGGSWEDADAAGVLDAAVAGVDAVFFISAPSLADLDAERRGAANVVAAATGSPSVRHIVYSTVLGADRYRDIPGWDGVPFMKAYWTSKAAGEDLVRSAGLPYYTILRPGEFMSNYTDAHSALFQLSDLVREGVWRTALPGDFGTALIDVEDIGRAAAAAMADPERLGRGLEVGLAAHTLPVAELVALLGAAAGKSLRLSTYGPQEAAEVAQRNPIVAGQLMRLAAPFIDGKGEEDVAARFGFRFGTFSEHLAAHRDEAVELYKDAP